MVERREGTPRNPEQQPRATQLLQGIDTLLREYGETPEGVVPTPLRGQVMTLPIEVTWRDFDARIRAVGEFSPKTNKLTRAWIEYILTDGTPAPLSVIHANVATKNSLTATTRGLAPQDNLGTELVMLDALTRYYF